jgi:hypothetical protein
MKANCRFVRIGLTLSGALMLLSAACAENTVDIRVGVAPPAPRVEYRAAPRRGHVWLPGYWAWEHGRYVWFAGHWERERRGYRYVERRWELVAGEWHFLPGYWAPAVQPPVMVAPPPAPVYVERGDAVPAPQSDPANWYYCHNPDGYYPYVKQCASGWEKVTPKPPGER